jgi:hypothetical protein
MSTNSTIAVVNEDGSVSSVYCHFDGYISHTGFALLQQYNTYEKAASLIGEGNISCVDIRVGHTKYCQDALETDVTTHEDLTVFYKTQQFQEYNYLLYENQWYVSKFDDNFNLLEV